ncbi:MAG: cyanophycin synthetase [candidate division WS6 bacterium 34_10]|uniref:Cyanophycin synthetase n=1 Tax=candidate division WS6 bacterium 34_10 TaxID=1641389 RepID=A0A101HHW2_9BACT|nr:MAG: cyanophycin synthetase [candidate division WS6 bacterium 34_10]
MKNIKTVQGLNLQSPTTYVEIEDIEQSKDVNKLLDLIQNFHPIFIESYTNENNVLTISSKLPALWRESSNTLRDLSKSKISYEKAKDYLLNTVIKMQLKSMSTIPILHKAQQKGYETTLSLVDEGIIPGVKEGYGYKWNRYYTLGCGKGSQVTCSISSSKDSSFAKNIQQDKWATNKIIERMGLPLPKWDIVKDKKDIDKLWDQYQKPIVIKPTGLTGGNGVTVGIKTKEKAYQAFDYAKEKINEKIRKNWQKKIMIQEQAEGDENGADYRLLVINGVLKACTKRIPAFVVGNGKNTIEELILKENKDPRRDLTNPAHILKPIEIDPPLIQFLKKNGLTLQSIPKKNQRVYVRNVASMSRGGITEDFTDKVAPEIKTIVESIAATMHVFSLGLDIICNDISKPLTKENGAILEVNTMPESYLNFYPVIGQERTDALDYYIEQLLKDNQTQRIVVIGQTKDDIPTLLRNKRVIDKDSNIGFYKNNNIIINNSEFNKDIETWKAIEALKVNALLDTIILQYRDMDEVKEHGLGFDRIDTLFLTKEIRNNKKAMKVFRKYRRKKLIQKIKRI